ncbi:alkaline shock response membrane anchor protein AmaP [Lentzea sp.]|uniref:alkaline shock response membrane anchor protein AmaP n=1 Tax=Lentzea sp. TaxID=56099 RepID=UPI002ED28700
MSSPNRPARLNRTLLGLSGVLLLAAGAFGTATHLRLLRVVDPAAPLVPGTTAPPTWVFYVIAAAGVVTGLLALFWLLAQVARRPRTGTWRFERDPVVGRTELDTDVAVAPFTDEVRSLTHVRQAKAVLTGTRREPELALVVSADQNADLTVLRERITTECLPRLAQALGTDRVPATVEFRLSAQAGTRVS